MPTTSPYMKYPIPTPSVDAQGTAEQNVTTCLTINDAHDHITVGKPLTTAAININGDLTFNTLYNATNLRAARFANQSAPLAGVGDLLCVYFNNGDYWINNGSGVPVQITSGGSLNIGAITNIQLPFLSLAADKTILSTDTYVLLNVDTSAARAITLPAANAVAAGRWYIIKDRSGSASSGNITISRVGADLIDGASTVIINANYGCVALASDGVSKWSVLISTQLIGDVIGNVANNTVVKVHGVSYPALPSPSTLPIITSANTVTYQQLADAQVSASAAIAGTKISPNFGSQSVVTTGTISVGTTPAGSGGLRVPNNTTAVAGRNAANSGDAPLISIDSSDNLNVGGAIGVDTNTVNTNVAGQNAVRVVVGGAAGGAVINATASTITFGSSLLNFQPNSVDALSITPSVINANLPVGAKAGVSFSWQVQNVTLSTGNSAVTPSSPLILCSGSLSGSATVLLPAATAFYLVDTLGVTLNGHTINVSAGTVAKTVVVNSGINLIYSKGNNTYAIALS